MKDIKFVIIILLMFFGVGIMAQINDYDYNVNNTGIMYQENNNIALNENNRFYDYDINYNLDESYLHYFPIKKSGLLDNYDSKNLAVPDLDGKEYLGNGVYNLGVWSGVTITYNVYNGVYTMNGTITTNPTGFIPLTSIINVSSVLTINVTYVSGSVNYNRPIFSYSINGVVNQTFTYILQNPDLRIIDGLNGDFVFGIRRTGVPSGEVNYYNYQFKL